MGGIVSPGRTWRAPERDKRIIAVIPARGGSVSIPRKNIKPLAGRCLQLWCVLSKSERGDLPCGRDNGEAREGWVGSSMGGMWGRVEDAKKWGRQGVGFAKGCVEVGAAEDIGCGAREEW